MYEEMGYSQADAQPPSQVVVTGSTSNSHCSMEELSEFYLSPQDTVPTAAKATTQLPFHAQSIQQMVHDSSGTGSGSMHMLPQYFQSTWDGGFQDLVNVGPSSTAPDLLCLFHLPPSSFPPPILPNSSISFPSSNVSDIMATSSAAHDPLFHLNFPLQSHFTPELPSLPPPNGGMMYADGNNHVQFDSEVLEFSVDTKRKGRRTGKMKTFPTERERRVHFKDRFIDLKNLIPSPTKADRASIVGDAIEYIKELRRTIEEFKILLEKKRYGKHRSMRVRTEEGDSENKPYSEIDQSFNKNNSLRCSWLRRKSKVTEIDVRIIDDEINIKLVQKKKINCLLFVSKVLEELHLDLHNVSGGQIGEHYSFMFSTKIYEGSCVYASAIADTLMEVVEQQYMAAVPTCGY